MDDTRRSEIEAAVFRRLVWHFCIRADVQNIDVMNTAGFCRNCLAKWYRAAAADQGVTLSYDDAREIVYGMPYDDWKAKHQTKAAADTVQAFKEGIARHGEAGAAWFDEPL